MGTTNPATYHDWGKLMYTDTDMVCGWCGDSESDCQSAQSGNRIMLVTRKEFEDNGPQSMFPDWDN